MDNKNKAAANEYANEHQTIIRLQFCRWQMDPTNIDKSEVSRLSGLANIIGGTFDEAIEFLNAADLQYHK